MHGSDVKLPNKIKDSSSYKNSFSCKNGRMFRIKTYTKKDRRLKIFEKLKAHGEFFEKIDNTSLSFNGAKMLIDSNSICSVLHGGISVEFAKTTVTL